MAALGLLTACATAVTAPPPASVERPALAVGDTWVVVKRVPPLRTVQTLVDVRGTTLVFRQTAPGGQSSAATYTPDRALFQGGVDDVSMWGPVTLPYPGALAFPLRVGKRWQYRWAGTMPDLSRRGTVVNWELAARVTGGSP